MTEDLYIADDYSRREIQRAIRKIDSISGPGVVNNRERVYIQPTGNGGRGAIPAEPETWPVEIVELTGSSSLGGAWYLGYRHRWRVSATGGVPLVDPTQNLDVANDLIEYATPVTCYLWNQAESGWTTHRIAVNTIVIAWSTPMTIVEGQTQLPVFGTNYSRAIRDLRQNTADTANPNVQVAYSDKPTDQLLTGDWTDKIPVSTCGPTSTADLMTFMRPR